MPFLFPRSLVRMAPSTQGHVEAVAFIGGIYYWGQGVAVDKVRAVAAYKIAAEGGNALCQHQLGMLFSEEGHGCDVDYKLALVWLEKAAAQEFPAAIAQLGHMATTGRGQPVSWRRARAFHRRAAALGHEHSIKEVKDIKNAIQKVTRKRPI